MAKLGRYLLAALVAAYFISTTVLFVNLHDTNHTLSTNINSQVPNRASNVKAWCGGINDSRDYDRRFVAAVTHGRIAYRLGDLDCKALVAKTLKSASHK